MCLPVLPKRLNHSLILPLNPAANLQEIQTEERDMLTLRARSAQLSCEKLYRQTAQVLPKLQEKEKNGQGTCSSKET